jgi:hypothetical protein
MGPKTGYAWLVIAILLWASIACVGQVVTSNQYGKTFTEPVTVPFGCSVTFDGCAFSGSGRQLYASPFSSVTVQNCTFTGTNPNRYGASGATGIWSTGAAKLWVSNCTFTGLCVEILEDGTWGYPDVWIAWNTFQHANVALSDGRGGWLNQGGWGTGVCIMHTKGWNPPDGSHHTIVVGNNFINLLGIDQPSDSINLYESTGVIVRSNQISGAKGFYPSGENANGIVTDDEWSDARPKEHIPGEFNWTTAYCTIENNILINASIGIWAGHDNLISGNTIKNTGIMATGQACPIPIIGIGRFYPEGLEWAKSNVVSGNTVNSLFQGKPYNYDNQAGESGWFDNGGF